MEGHKLRVLLLSHNTDGKAEEWKKEIKYIIVITTINIKLVSQAASLEEARIHVTFKHNCVYRENYAMVKMSMGRIFVSVLASESRGGICVRALPDTRIIYYTPKSVDAIQLLQLWESVVRRDCKGAIHTRVPTVSTIVPCIQMYKPGRSEPRCCGDCFLSVFLLLSLFDSSPSQYGTGYQMDDLVSILQIVQTDSEGPGCLFFNGYRGGGGVSAKGRAVETEADNSLPSKAEVKNY